MVWKMGCRGSSFVCGDSDRSYREDSVDAEKPSAAEHGDNAFGKADRGSDAYSDTVGTPGADGDAYSDTGAYTDTDGDTGA